jgi:hypothetical protein
MESRRVQQLAKDRYATRRFQVGSGETVVAGAAFIQKPPDYTDAVRDVLSPLRL